MSDTMEALGRLVAEVDAGTDVLVGGTPVEARRLLAEAALALADRATVVSVSCPLGELTLSTLIAQLSGRLDLDDQDDAVLELGFKRLKGEGQTVLTVLAPAGISRSALRYLQHVSRQSPRLVMAVYDAPPLAAALADPGLAALRERLQGDAPADVAASALVAYPAPAAALPAAETFPILSIAAPVAPVPKRRRMLWAAAALTAATVGGVVWVGHSAPGTAVAGGRLANVALLPAAVSVPMLVGSAAPPLAVASLPDAVDTAGPLPARSGRYAPARLPQIALATLPPQPPSLPPLLPLAHPEALAASAAVPQSSNNALLQSRRADAARREATRLARERAYWATSRNLEARQYDAPPSWDGVSPIWVRRDPRRGENSYLGTYAVGPNGVRVFQYDP